MLHKIEGWLCWEQWEFQDSGKLTFRNYKPEDCEYLFPLREYAIEVEGPEKFDTRPGMVAAIDVQIKQKRAELTKEINDLLEKKARLLAITNEVTA